MLEKARRNVADSGVAADIQKMDCHQLAFADASFDLVVSRNVTHALRDHRRVYTEWLRVLKPGGVLLIFGKSFIGLFLEDPSPEVTTAAYRFLLFAAVPGILNGVMCIYQQTLRGVGKATEAVIGGFMQLGAKVLAALLGARVFLQLDVVWLAWPISFVAGTIFPFLVYRSMIRGVPEEPDPAS